MSRNAQNSIFRETGLVFEPLVSADSAYRVTALFRELGYELPNGSDFPGFPGFVARVRATIEAIIQFDQASDDDKAKVLTDLIVQIVQLTKEIIALEQAVKDAVTSFPTFTTNARLDQLPIRLLDYLIFEYTQHHRPKFHAVMRLLGIFDVTELSADGSIFQPETALRTIHYDLLPILISKPAELFDRVYEWNTSFDSNKFFSNVDKVLRAFLLPGGLYNQNSILKKALGNTADNLKELRFPILQNAIFPSTYSQFGLNVTSVQALEDKKAGFAIIPYIFGAASFDFDLNETFEIVFKSTAAVDAGLGIIVRPDVIDFMNNLFNTPQNAATFDTQLSLQQREGTGEIILFGTSDATRLAIEGPTLKVFASNQLSGIDTGVELKLDAIRLVVTGGEGDSFLNTLLGPGGINAEAGFVVGLSARQGFYFVGSGGLELRLATHITLGPLEIQGIIIGFNSQEGNFVIEGGATLKAELGPLVCMVENMGLKTTLNFPDEGGNLGPANLAFAFKPPNGVGLSINAGVVKGGGYLYFDFDKEEYAGALELVFQDFLTLKAIGIVTTRMPDGSKGFSLLIIITAEFATGIQLGFGFKLIGVGGLLGLNRAMRLQPLVDGVRTGAINSIMFPQDVVANAPRIISDLKTIFPPEQGKFLIGPMAKLAWGTPTLITLSLGIIIEIPGNIAIVGVLQAILPSEDKIVLVLRVNFAGVIEFDKKRVYFFASIFDSRVLFMTIEGEMGVLVAFGDDANFVVTVGGFHPSFNPPPLPFPSPVRVTINILNESNARIRVMAYFAITSNTAQFGAHAELFFGFDSVKVEGHLGFDVLIQFSPFYFIAEVSASVSLKVAGIDALSIRLQFSLEGPTPWRARGTGSIKLLFFEVSANFDITWGEERDTTLPPIDVIPLLTAEFGKVSNWKAELPASNNLLVTLRPTESDVIRKAILDKISANDQSDVSNWLDDLADETQPDEIAKIESNILGKVSSQPDKQLVQALLDAFKSSATVLHPSGTLQLSQKAVPLEKTINKVGNQKPSDANYFKLTVSTSGFGQTDILEQFAIAQYEDIDDARKLSAPAYQPIKGGIKVSVTGQELRSSKVIRRVVRYEQIIIDTNYKRYMQRFSNFVASLFNHFLQGASVSKSLLSQQHQQQMVPFPSKDRVKVTNDGHTVVFQSTNKALNGNATFPSQAMANEYMQQTIAADPSQADALQVIPQSEVVA